MAALSSLHRRFMLNISILLILLMLVSCQQITLDRSYLEGSPCHVPCWQNITPGITDESSAMTILSDPNLIESDSLRCQRDSETGRINGCRFRRTTEEGGQISFHDGIVRTLMLKTHNLTLDEVISVLGPPDYLMNLQGSQILSEGNCYRVDLLYLGGMYFTISGCDPLDSKKHLIHNNLLVSTEMQVVNVRLFIPGNGLEESLSNLYGPLKSETEIETIRSWTGYGYYSLVP
jgi:hypothetical protein